MTWDHPMRFWLPLAVLCCLSCGCSLAVTATRNTCYEVQETKEKCVEAHRNRQLAKQAWNQVHCADPSHPYSSDHIAGFEAGYADYLYAGGNGEPPPIPPKCYW